jgi:hypothetical protein
MASTFGFNAVPMAKELLQAIEDAGGVLRVPDPPDPQRRHLRQAIHALINGDELPPGTRVRHSGRDRGDVVVRITEEQRPPPKPEPLPVPQNLRNAHPLIAATWQDRPKGTRWVWNSKTPGRAHLNVMTGNLHRALRLLQAVGNEAERRGYEVGTVKPYGCPGGFGIVINDDALELFVREETERIPNASTVEQQREVERQPWSHRKYLPTGRLQIRVGHPSYDKAPLAADRQRWKLEDRIGRIVDRLEERAEQEALRRAEWRRQKEEEQRRRDLAFAVARERYEEHYRIEQLSAQIQDSENAERARRFAAAARQARNLSDADLAWIRWVEDYASRIDPLGRQLAPLAAPDTTEEQLRPFLWSGSASSR